MGRLLVASRRDLERDLANLVDQHSFQRVIHALVEVCHGHLRRGQIPVDGQDVCAVLSEAERIAGKMC